MKKDYKPRASKNSSSELSTESMPSMSHWESKWCNPTEKGEKGNISKQRITRWSPIKHSAYLKPSIIQSATLKYILLSICKSTEVRWLINSNRYIHTGIHVLKNCCCNLSFNAIKTCFFLLCNFDADITN